ncbi:hypothetical protein C8T65DRAFT_745110 [Cerioporus squamosus]|nr:hypothetical protein C8T65DRAFT_745110 [Cerioporus squamosus]
MDWILPAGLSFAGWLDGERGQAAVAISGALRRSCEHCTGEAYASALRIPETRAHHALLKPDLDIYTQRNGYLREQGLQ